MTGMLIFAARRFCDMLSFQTLLCLIAACPGRQRCPPVDADGAAASGTGLLRTRAAPS